jgi:hypothetical protein
MNRAVRIASLAVAALTLSRLDPPDRARGGADPPVSTRQVQQKVVRALDAQSAGVTATDDEEKVREGLTRLGPAVWVDTKRKHVVLEGRVAMRRGPPLELFACLKGTKEHESIVSVPTKAFMVHAALLAVGAKPGRPVQFEPAYTPASGDRIDIEVRWIDLDGDHKSAKAQDWIRDTRTGKAMAHSWVFGGSGTSVNPATGQKVYWADAGGELICVSNFSSALLDLPIHSSADASALLFEALTKNIPPVGTRVRLVLCPSRAEKPAEKRPAEKKPAETAAETTKR